MALEMYKLHQIMKMSVLVSNFLLLLFLYFLETGRICVDFKFPEEFLYVSLPIQLPSKEMYDGDHFHHVGSNTTLLNMSNFKYILNNETMCPSYDPQWKILLIIVHTARKNYRNRDAIRTTWGSLRKYKNWKIRLLFTVGRAGSPDTNKAQRSGQTLLEFESKKHGDIIQGNFIDSYRNMTYKHIMDYQWAVTFCGQANYVFKIDDDVFSNIFGVIDTLNNYSDEYSLMCPILVGQAPNRGQDDKWLVTMEEYSSAIYPPYCLGAGYLISMKWVRILHSVAAKIKFFWIDDVFVTGILREYAQVQTNEKVSLLDIRNIWVDTKHWDFMTLHSTHSFYNSGIIQYFALYCYMDSHSTDFAYDMKILWEKALRLYFLSTYELD